jgi:hypothetical protein
MNKEKIEIASDVNTRDGIGIIVYQDEELILEIFRDDTDKTRIVTVYNNKEISIEDMERYIGIFKNDIPWDFIEY